MGKFIFDGDNRRIYINNAYVANNMIRFSAVELWSRYVDWCAEPGNSVYPRFFDRIGGNSIGIDADGVEQFLGTYIFFRNDIGLRGVPPSINGVTVIIDGPFYAADPMQKVMENNVGQETNLVINNPTAVLGISTSGSSGPSAVDIASEIVNYLFSSQTGLLTTDQNNTLISARDNALLARQLASNKVVVSSDERLVTVYNDEGTAPLHQFEVSEDKHTREPV